MRSRDIAWEADYGSIRKVTDIRLSRPNHRMLPRGRADRLHCDHPSARRTPVLPGRCQQHCPIRAVLPKQKSICEDVYADVRERFPVDRLSRKMFADTEASVEYLEEVTAGQRLVLLDVGGYFAHCLNEMCTQLSGSICGVIEETENGLFRYRQLDKPP